jgi:hypothetical protein
MWQEFCLTYYVKLCIIILKEGKILKNGFSWRRWMEFFQMTVLTGSILWVRASNTLTGLPYSTSGSVSSSLYQHWSASSLRTSE